MTRQVPKIIRKDRSGIEIGQRQTAHLTFRPLSEADLKKELGEDIPDGYIAGWASTPDLDHYRHVVAAGAFSEAISTRGLTGPSAIKLLIGHDWDKVAGVIKVLEYRGDRLWIEAQLGLNISYVKDAYEATKMLGGMNFSVGFYLQDYEWKEDANKVDYLFIKRGDLFEVSVVPFPGNEAATMEFIKSAGEGDDPKTVAEFEKALVARGLVKNRNDAARVTQAVKSCGHLFQKKAESREDQLSQRPRLAKDAVDEALVLAARIKELIAPAA